MKAPPIAEEILQLRKEIITTGMDKLRNSNIEKVRRLNELLKKLNDNEKV